MSTCVRRAAGLRFNPAVATKRLASDAGRVLALAYSEELDRVFGFNLGTLASWRRHVAIARAEEAVKGLEAEGVVFDCE